MKSKILAAAAVLTLGAGMAAADAMTDTIEHDLARQGFKDIQFNTDDGQLTVEARRGSQSIELVYDTASGDLISRDGQRTTGLDRAEQVSGKSLPQGRMDDDDDEADDHPGRGRATADRNDREDDRGGEDDDDSDDDSGSDDQGSDGDDDGDSDDGGSDDSDSGRS